MIPRDYNIILLFLNPIRCRNHPCGPLRLCFILEEKSLRIFAPFFSTRFRYWRKFCGIFFVYVVLCLIVFFSDVLFAARPYRNKQVTMTFVTLNRCLTMVVVILTFDCSVYRIITTNRMFDFGGKFFIRQCIREEYVMPVVILLDRDL